MAINETRIRVSLIDNATSGLSRLSSTNSRFVNSLRSSGSALTSFNRNLTGFSTGIDNSVAAADRMSRTVQSLTYSLMRYTVIYKGLSAIGNVWNEFVGGAYEYSKELETNRIGIAGILASMTEVNGKALDMQDALLISNNIMRDLQNESLKTTATAGELVNTFRALLGPGLGAGMNIGQIEKLTTVGVNAVKSIGLSGPQLIQELRDLVQGGIRPASSTLATALGLTDSDIKKAKQSSEGLFNFLMRRLKGFEAAMVLTQGTTQGMIDQIKEGITRGLSEGGNPLFEYYKKQLAAISAQVITVNDNLEYGINEDFKNRVTEISGSVIKAVEAVKSVSGVVLPIFSATTLKPAATLIGQIVDNLSLFAGGMLLKKGGNILTDLTGVMLSKTGTATPQTSIGRMYNGFLLKISGYQADMERLNQQVQIFGTNIDAAMSKAARIQDIDSFLKTNENSVINLTSKWREMGMSIEQAATYERQMLQLAEEGDGAKLGILARRGYEQAEQASALLEKQKQINAAYGEQARAVQSVVDAEVGKQNVLDGLFRKELSQIREVVTQTTSAERTISNFLNSDGENRRKLVPQEQRESVTALMAELERLGLETQKVNELTAAYINTIKQDADSMGAAYEQAIRAANGYLSVAQRISTTGRAGANVQAFMDSATASDTAKSQLQALLDKFRELNISEEQAAEFANQWINALNRVGEANIGTVTTAVQTAAQQYAVSVQTINAQKERQIALERETALQMSATTNAYRVGGESAYQALTSLITREQELVEALRKRGAATEEVESRHLELLKAVTAATDENIQATLLSAESAIKADEAAAGLNRTHQTSIETMAGMVGRLGGLTMSFGILSDAIAANVDEDNDWIATMGESAVQTGFVITAVADLASGFVALVPKIEAAVVALKTWIAWSKAAAIGAGGLAALGVGAVVAGAAQKYSDYKKNGINVQSYLENNPDFYENAADYSGMKIAAPVEQAQQVAKASAVEKRIQDAIDRANRLQNQLSKRDFGGGATGQKASSGGGRSGSGSGGSSAAERAAERHAQEVANARAKLAADTASLSEEIAKESRGSNSAYDSIMESARKRIAAYQSDEKKISALGINTDELAYTIKTYQNVMKEKARKAQREEEIKNTIQGYDNSIAHDKNLFLTSDGQVSMIDSRSLMEQDLQAKRDYLKSILTDSELNAKQRLEIEQELARTTQDLYENGAYNFSTAWKSALASLEEDGINFGNMSMNIIDGVSGAISDLFTTSGSFADRLKTSFKNLAQSIIQSLAQIYSKMIVFKMLGIPFGNNFNWGGNSAFAHAGVGYSISGGSISFGGLRAAGGDVQRGKSYIVGENGPELLTMGQNGHVWNSLQGMSGGYSGAANVKVVINNNTGTQMEARQQTTMENKKEIHTIILSTVSNAIQSNEYGLRDAVKYAK